jgi:hypothetical protein
VAELHVLFFRNPQTFISRVEIQQHSLAQRSELHNQSPSISEIVIETFKLVEKVAIGFKVRFEDFTSD